MKKFIEDELSGWKIWEVVWLSVATLIILCVSLYWRDNFIGITTAVTGVICVVATGKGKMSCYLFGLINTVLYAVIALNAKYYGEVMLNALYYVPMQFVGWFSWRRHMDAETLEVRKTRLKVKWELAVLCIALAGIYVYGSILRHLGGRLPFVDSMSTCLSVLAMILSVKRLMEQWILWIVVDVVTVYMWASVFLQGGSDIATLLMWMVYLLNAVIMFIKWFKESRKMDECQL